MDATVTSGEAEVEQESGGLVIRRGRRRRGGCGEGWESQPSSSEQMRRPPPSIAGESDLGDGSAAGQWNMDGLMEAGPKCQPSTNSRPLGLGPSRLVGPWAPPANAKWNGLRRRALLLSDWVVTITRKNGYLGLQMLVLPSLMSNLFCKHVTLNFLAII